ncbi:hypothetical protein C815_01920 [Firmicutes bacterium M10-2]|nr:hypothetical protein C815_01920 [Firmicutes bacterium M10-2]
MSKIKESMMRTQKRIFDFRNFFILTVLYNDNIRKLSVGNVIIFQRER